LGQIRRDAREVSREMQINVQQQTAAQSMSYDHAANYLPAEYVAGLI
jgi:hypothetical protein